MTGKKIIDGLEKTIIITGHYGAGKTNLALNLALLLRKNGRQTALIDLDIVNPYFRTADFKTIAEQNGISLSASDYANSNLDAPALSGGIDAGLSGGGTLIIDVGGDDAGAFALGRYSNQIKQRPYTMLYVINAYRYLMKQPEEAAALLNEIEKASRLEATHIANCSSLGVETTADDILNSLEYARKTSELCEIPLMFTAADKRLSGPLSSIRDLFPVDIYVKTPWG